MKSTRIKAAEVADGIRKQVGRGNGNGSQAPPHQPVQFLQGEAMELRATNALARAAEACGRLPAGQQTIYTRLSETLEEDSALFVNYSYRFLALNHCPGDARDIVLVVIALTGGRFDRFHPIEQEEMARFMGLSVRTVQRKLRALEEWECEIKRAVIEITKQGRGEGSVHYKTTLYKPTIALYVGEFMRRVTQGRTPSGNGYEAKAFTEVTKKFLRDVRQGQVNLLGDDLSAFERTDEQAVAEQIKQGMPKVDPIKQRRVKARREREQEERETSEEAENLKAQAVILKKQVKQLETKARKLAPRVTSNRLEALGGARRRLITNFEDWCELLHQNGFSLTESLQELQTELQEIIVRYAEAYGG